MTEVVGLVRQFPEGTFFLLLALIWATERVIVSLVNRNKPPAAQCNCTCCDLDDEEEDE